LRAHASSSIWQGWPWQQPSWQQQPWSLEQPMQTRIPAPFFQLQVFGQLLLLEVS